MKILTVTALNHRNQSVLMLSFTKDHDLISICKQLGAQYSATHRGWYVPLKEGQKELLEKAFKGIAVISCEIQKVREPVAFPIKGWTPKKITQLSPRNQENMKQFRRFMRSKRFAESTIKISTSPHGAAQSNSILFSIFYSFSNLNHLNFKEMRFFLYF